MSHDCGFPQQGWEVVGKYISGQQGYEEADTVPVVLWWMKKRNMCIKQGTIRFITNFLEGSIKNSKFESFYSPVMKR